MVQEGKGNEITRIRVVFKYAEDNRLIEGRVNYGTEFKRPKKKVLRANRYATRQAHGKRMFEAKELKAIIDAAGVPLKAMILLASNCGYGNGDIKELPIRALDLEKGWAEFPRPKTPVGRNRGRRRDWIFRVSAALGSGWLGGGHAAAPMIVAAGYLVAGRRGETRVR
jgi:hypothetical protein